MYLELSLGQGLSERIALDREALVVGGDSACDVMIPSSRSGSAAFRLAKRTQGWIVELIDGKSGALLNEKPFVTSTMVNGDTLLLDGMRMTFRDTNVVAAGRDELSALADETTPTMMSNALDWQQAAHVRLVGSTTLRDTAGQFVKAATWACSPATPKVVLFERVLEGWRALAGVASTSAGPLTIDDDAAQTLLRVGRPLVAIEAGQRGCVRRGLVPLICDGRMVAVMAFDCGTGPAIPQMTVWALQRFAWLCAPVLQARTLRRELDLWLRGSVDVIVAAVDAKDTYTRGHSERVSRFSLAIGERYGLDDGARRLLLMSGLCHDIGKIGVADAILKKPSILSAEEYEEIKAHPAMGADIIERLPNASEIIGGVRSHHERFDGTGYPDRLVGEDIPLFGRIVAIADAYDAMISGRSYSGYMTQQQALDRLVEISDCFDPDVLNACLKAAGEGAMTLRTGTVLSVA